MIEIKYNIIRPELQKNGYYMTYGWLVIDLPFHYDVWPAVSGRFGRGTIPIGIYKVANPVILGNQPENKPYKKEGSPWIAALNPIGKCLDDYGDRTGLLLHPDGNIDGTLGCIGITERDLSLYDMIKYIFETYKKEVVLHVC